MELITKAPRGTKDILPSDSYKWQYTERTLAEVSQSFGFFQVRFPTFEHSELYNRGIGEATDVIQKEMYSFEDKGGRSITLRPEGTAGVVRLMLENGLYGGAMPLKLYYITSCFRYEKPQAGRYREFNQYGIEVFGANSTVCDVEVISIGHAIFKRFGLDDITLNINSIGCKECRGLYFNALKDYFNKYKSDLCVSCVERLEKNPMRILDCKSPVCGNISAKAPLVLDYICKKCSDDFISVKSMLDSMEIDYIVNPKIVRGLDYYNGIVFEFISNSIGSQGAVCAGGRYDGLAMKLGGENVSGIGFALGIERLIMMLENQGKFNNITNTPTQIYIAGMGENAAVYSLVFANKLREKGIDALCDIMGKSLKAQMKYADKIGAAYTMVVGDDEIKTGNAKLKNMQTGESVEVCIKNIEEIINIING